MTADELAALNEQIAGMARAGLPLDRGLAALAHEMGRSRLKRVTLALSHDLKQGMTLPAALERHKGDLPPYYSALALAGIRTGQLADVLASLTTYARTIASMRSIIIEALAYPIMVTLFAAFVFGFLSLAIVPQFQSLYDEFKLPIPMGTRWAMTVAANPVSYIVIPLGGVLFAFVLARLAIRQTDAGLRAWTHVVYSIPLLGTLVRSARLASFVELLSVLVRSLVPLPEAFELAGNSSSDPFIVDESKDIRKQLERGTELGQALSGRDLLPSWVAWMSAAGERQGTLAGTLHEVAMVYRRHVETRAAVLRNLLPSIFVIVLAGLLTLFFVVGLGGPLINLIEGLSK